MTSSQLFCPVSLSCQGRCTYNLKFLSSAYKSSAAEALLAERGRIDSSHQMVDATLEYALHRGFVLLFRLIGDCRQARETRAEFSRQRSSIGSIQTRMVGVLSP
jgi:Golgi SNAP receptor complex protein 1